MMDDGGNHDADDVKGETPRAKRHALASSSLVFLGGDVGP